VNLGVSVFADGLCMVLLCFVCVRATPSRPLYLDPNMLCRELMNRHVFVFDFKKGLLGSFYF